MNNPFFAIHLKYHNGLHSNKPNYIKIKYVIWVNCGVAEVINTYAIVKKYGFYYHLYFDDCISADNHALFDSKKRVFYSN